MSAGGDRWLPGLIPASSCSQSGSRDGEGQARPEEGGVPGNTCPLRLPAPRGEGTVHTGVARLAPCWQTGPLPGNP